MVSMLLALMGTAAENPVAERPFPQHVTYVAGSIKPTDHTQAELDRGVGERYAAWKKGWLRAGCGEGRYYVYLGPQDPVAGGTPMVVSEGQGYGMMIVAHMAGLDPDARTIFDGLYRFYRDHPSGHDPDLMAWRQLVGCKSSSDDGTATDGDLSIAYALLLADRQWGSGGAIDYRAAARRMIAAIARHDLHPTTALPRLGAIIPSTDLPLYDTVRPSDIGPADFRSFLAATGQRRWQEALDAGYAMLDRLQRRHAPHTGLVPEFAIVTGDEPRPAPAGYLDTPHAGSYDFNACRVPWRVATDYLLNGDRRARAIVERIERWVVEAAKGDPHAIRAGYRLDGTPLVDFGHVCFTGAFAVGAMVDGRFQPWLNRLWDAVADPTIVDPPRDYYGATLRVLYMLVLSGNWWVPEAVPPAPKEHR
jgi:endo-1,4-beta-D-glucanase Y